MKNTIVSSGGRMIPSPRKIAVRNGASDSQEGFLFFFCGLPASRLPVSFGGSFEDVEFELSEFDAMSLVVSRLLKATLGFRQRRWII